MILCQCPCCDYFTLEQGCDYEICPVCFWEDDYFGFEAPDEPSGANHGLTLREARNNFIQYGVCALEFKDKVLQVSEREGFRYELRAI